VGERAEEKVSGFIGIVKYLFKLLSKFLIASKISLDEVINIVRPVVYVWSIIKYGRKSYRPLKISFALDLVQIVMGMMRLVRSSEYENKNRVKNLPARKSHFILSLTEKNQIFKRFQMSLLKYLIREPLFSNFVRPQINRVLGKLYVPEPLIGYLLAYINYHRYFSFIA